MEEFLANTPPNSVTKDWAGRKKQLDEFGLADVSLMPYVNRIAMLGMSEWWERGRYPFLENWWQRIQGRNTFKSSILDWCPEDLTNDLMTYGSKSWPEVRQILMGDGSTATR